MHFITSHVQFPELRATDADTISTGEITYTLAGEGSQMFTINTQTAEITTAAVFDAEEVQSFNTLQVTATDNGGLNSTIEFTILIADQNEFSPNFTIPDSNIITISEALQPGAQVFIVTARDDDVQGNTLNFTLERILNEAERESDEFAIDSLTGAITVSNQELDYESSSSFILTVGVHDSGVPTLSNSINISILLTDVNDNSPSFIPSLQMFFLEENSPLGEAC